MKLSTNIDFTTFPRAEIVLRAAAATGASPAADSVSLPHDERHLRRRALTLASGARILVDLAEPVALESGDRLVLEDGRQIEILAAPEDLLEIRGRDPVHLAELAWHIGNRHLAAAIQADRILILHDHVIDDMLVGLGAHVAHINAPFSPLRGAYAAHDHGLGHNDHDSHAHDHESHAHHGHGPSDQGHSDHDSHGRLPGDPHYGHNHA